MKIVIRSQRLPSVTSERLPAYAADIIFTFFMLNNQKPTILCDSSHAYKKRGIYCPDKLINCHSLIKVAADITGCIEVTFTQDIAALNL